MILYVLPSRFRANLSLFPAAIVMGKLLYDALENCLPPENVEVRSWMLSLVITACAPYSLYLRSTNNVLNALEDSDNPTSLVAPSSFDVILIPAKLPD